MSRILQHKTSVKLDEQHIPSTFTWRGRVYQIAEMCEHWRLMGAWWDGEGEYTFFRVRVLDGGFYELCYDHHRRGWMLNVVQD